MARMMELSTPLGKDLLFRELRGREELGRPSAFELSALSTRADIKPSDLLGKSVTVKLELVKGGFRYFNGYVTRFSQGTIVGKYYEYQMTVNAWLWFLTRTADCKIFQEKTAPDIIKEVFGDHKMAIFEDALSGSYAKREYTVQYRETDFAFVSRIMEEEGIFYYFEHKDGKHTLKLVDGESGYKKLENKASIAYYPPGRALHGNEEYIQSFRQAQRIEPGTVATRSFDFANPKADLGVKAQNIQPVQSADYEVFDFQGDYIKTDNGEHLAQVRVDEYHSEFELAEAETNVRDIAVGRLFSLTNAPRKDQEKDYLIVSAEWGLRNNTYEASINEDAAYSCTMTVLQSKQQFRPARSTPRPTMGGPQTAVVVGPGGEEIYTDKYGRVKVQFHWDRYGKKNENSSCWMRVSSPWAGANWGGVAIPRIGQEVVVDFLEGDPDQPLIVGRLYNADQMPPYALPGNMTQTGIKTRSSKGGGAANFNEIRFEDKKGSEQVFLHAEKNQDIEVEKDETHWVGQDRKKTIDRDEMTHVKHDRTERVGNNETILIDNNKKVTVVRDHDESVGGNMTIGVKQSLTETVALNYAETVGVAMELSVGAALAISVGAAMTETVGINKTQAIGKSKDVTVGDNMSVEVGKNVVEKVGENQTVEVGKDLKENIKGEHQETVEKDYMLKAKKILINADDEISIKTGSAEIVMKKNGDITVKGNKISIKGDGDVILKGSKIAEN
jgi:type VI secretion system secreted protein VgrG